MSGRAYSVPKDVFFSKSEIANNWWNERVYLISHFSWCNWFITSIESLHRKTWMEVAKIGFKTMTKTLTITMFYWSSIAVKNHGAFMLVFELLLFGPGFLLGIESGINPFSWYVKTDLNILFHLNNRHNPQLCYSGVVRTGSLVHWRYCMKTGPKDTTETHKMLNWRI